MLGGAAGGGESVADVAAAGAAETLAGSVAELLTELTATEVEPDGADVEPLLLHAEHEAMTSAAEARGSVALRSVAWVRLTRTGTPC